MYLDKSMDVLVTMLAVMKAGAICMPVDKRHPLRVVNQFVLSGGCVLLITDEVKMCIRDSYSYRVAIAASSLEELIQKIRDRLDHWDDTAPNASVSSRADFLSVEELSRADQIQQLAELYCQGTDINFLKYYERGRLVELPVDVYKRQVLIRQDGRNNRNNQGG